MKKVLLLVSTGVIIHTLSLSSAFAAVCDQSFNGGMLRYNKTYQFYDVWNNNGTATDYMNSFDVDYKDTASWLTTPPSTWSYLDPGTDFQFTQELRNAGF